MVTVPVIGIVKHSFVHLELRVKIFLDGDGDFSSPPEVYLAYSILHIFKDYNLINFNICPTL